jgi:hypothetical protein
MHGYINIDKYKYLYLHTYIYPYVVSIAALEKVLEDADIESRTLIDFSPVYEELTDVFGPRYVYISMYENVCI